jgi:prepilin-type N-terminal cleavage/methylation domain-containing protein
MGAKMGYMGILCNQSRLRAGFTLIEVVSVVAVILILAGIITIHLGDLRSSALSASARALEKEFAKGVEELTSNGVDLGPLQSVAASGSLVLETGSDPDYMSLQSSVYRLSSPQAANLALVSGALTQLNILLSGRGFGVVKGEVRPVLLAVFNADLVLVRDTGHSVRGVYLRFSKS